MVKKENFRYNMKDFRKDEKNILKYEKLLNLL